MRVDGTKRRMLAVLAAVAAAVLAGLLAVAVNLGIMRAAGSPTGPGRLDSTSVERQLPESPSGPAHQSRGNRKGEEDRSTKRSSPTPLPTWLSTPSPSGSSTSGSPTSSSSDGSGERSREFGSHADD